MQLRNVSLLFFRVSNSLCYYLHNLWISCKESGLVNKYLGSLIYLKDTIFITPLSGMLCSVSVLSLPTGPAYTQPRHARRKNVLRKTLCCLPVGAQEAYLFTFFWVWTYFPGHDTDVQIVFNKKGTAERAREHQMGRAYSFNWATAPPPMAVPRVPLGNRDRNSESRGSPE